jgi:hypothetical protein
LKRAQLLTIDFILSIAIFISILLTLMTVWGSVDTQIKDLEDRRDLQSLSVAITDSLVRSTGNPADWNSTNVKSIGLAETERVLSLRKIKSMFSMDYFSVKSKMRLSNYELQIIFTDKDSNNLTTGLARSPIAYYSRDPARTKVLEKLNNSGLVWDLYWGANPNDLPSHQNSYARRNFYANPNPVNGFNGMIDNQSAYRTIIIENLDLPITFENSDLNISGLQEFVSRGGILVVIGQGRQGANIIDQDFGADSGYQAAGWGEGTVLEPHYLLPESAAGETVSFGGSRWYFSSNQDRAEVNVVVSQTGHPGRGMLCFWQYGLGTIYYIEDMEGLVSGNPLQDSIHIVGEPMRFGLSPSLPSQVVTVRRTVLLEGFDRELASMEMRVWK